MRRQVAALESRLDGRTPFFALYIECTGRAGAVSGTAHEDAVEIQATVGARVPLLGVYGGLEIARVGGAPQALQWTGVLCLFSAA
jgi:small ligand-binding sensory domain FIST